MSRISGWGTAKKNKGKAISILQKPKEMASNIKHSTVALHVESLKSDLLTTSTGQWLMSVRSKIWYASLYMRHHSYVGNRCVMFEWFELTWFNENILAVCRSEVFIGRTSMKTPRHKRTIAELLRNISNCWRTLPDIENFRSSSKLVLICPELLSFGISHLVWLGLWWCIVFLKFDGIVIKEELKLNCMSCDLHLPNIGSCIAISILWPESHMSMP